MTRNLVELQKQLQQNICLYFLVYSLLKNSISIFQIHNFSNYIYTMQTLSLAISPCPNDTFIFDAMLHHKIDTEGLGFELIFADVEQLNEAAFQQKYDITKLSYHAFAYVAEHYVLLHSGSALGNNCGPLLISNNFISDTDLPQKKIAIPGKYTTANLLFSLKYPTATNKSFILFSEIENAVISEKFDAGVIIHENRFTYQEKGLQKIIDLGEYWENTYHVPIPLGGIAIQRKIDNELQKKVERIIKRSIEFAFQNPNSSADFVAQHSQEMSAEVCQQHINLYVNEFSVALGEKGKEAVTTLYKVAQEKDIIPPLPSSIFVN